ncbi:MAG: SEC-C domain-containing protein, partial [Acidimicrobiia bacterium]|nr:SEC-C domain-containing protein [Acidimicrobiia bacterium]
RKDVLKYDEVLNEQRKIIYRRRQQILDGGDLRDETAKAITDAVDSIIDLLCTGNYSEDWDVDELVLAMQALYASSITADHVKELHDVRAARAAFAENALGVYTSKEDSIGTEQLREIERRVMLSVIDQHWRDHLYEMDYLREGINLRAMGQQDPLAAWQREGYDMFEAMMGSIRDNFVQYVFRLEVVSEENVAAPERALTYSAADEPVQGASALAAAAVGFDDGTGAMGPAPEAEMPAQAPVRVERAPGRNEPCWCGSGKKFKTCHGA